MGLKNYTSGIGDLNATYIENPDYTGSLNPQTALRDPRFLQDLREHYRSEGRQADSMSEDELIEQFFEDQTFKDLNTISAVKSAFEARGASAQERQRLARIEKVWRLTPNFWEEGGRGWKAAFLDAGEAIIKDPTNLFPMASAAKIAGTAARVGATAGRATWQGVKGGALREGALTAGQEAAVSTSEQARDIELGLREDFSTAELAARAAAGGLLGGAVGGVISAPGALAAAKDTTDLVSEARKLGWTDQEIAKMNDAQLEQAAQSRTFVEPQPVRGDTGDGGGGAAEQPPTPEQQFINEFNSSEQQLTAQLQAYRTEYDKMRAEGADQEVLDETMAIIQNLSALRRMQSRLKAENAEILTLTESNDLKTRALARARIEKFENDFAEFKSLLADSDRISPEEIRARIDERMADAADAEDATPVAQEPAATAPAPAAEGEPLSPTPSPEAAAEAPAAPPAPEQAAAPAPAPADDVAEKAAAQALITTRARRIAEEAGFDFTGVTGTGRGGQITAKDITTAIKAAPREEAAAPSGAAQATPEVVITPEDRGRLLEAGIDWRTLTPNKKGRITSYNVERALTASQESGAAQVSPVAKQARQDLESMIDDLSMFDGDEESLRAAIRLMSADRSRVKSDVEDIMALFERLNNASKEADVGIEDAAKRASIFKTEFTKTERKKAQRYASILKRQNPEMTPEVAQAAGEARVISERGAPKPEASSNIRSTGDRIGEASIYTSAGRTAANRIQGFLKRGTRIAPGSEYTTTGQYTIRRNEIGRAAALAEARSGNGPDAVPYLTTGRESVISPEGMVEVPKGTRVYMDGLSGQAYADIDTLMRARGEDAVGSGSDEAFDIAMKKQATKRDIEDIKRQISAANRRGASAENINSLRSQLADAEQQLEELNRLTPRDVRPAAPEAPAAAPNKALNELIAASGGDFRKFRELLTGARPTEPAPRVASPDAEASGSLGDRLLIARSKTNPGDVRMMSPRQAADGKTLASIIGRKSNPADWDIRYAPASEHTYNKALLNDVFERAEGKADIQKVADTKKAMPIPANKLGSTTVDLSTEDIGLLVDALNTSKISGSQWAKTLAANLASTGNQIPLSHLLTYSSIIDSVKWPTNIKGVRTVMAAVERLNSLLAEKFPGGYSLPNVAKQEAVDSVTRIFEKHAPEEAASAKKFMELVASTHGFGPKVVDASNEAGWSSFAQGASPEGFYQHISIRANDEGGKRSLPLTTTLIHEVAHWAYRNILDPEDKAAFWRAMSKYYDEGGTLNLKTIEDSVPAFSGMKTHEGKLISGGNSMISPQELFANQFEMWVFRNHKNLGYQDEKFWGRVARMVKAVFDRYFSKAKIDPDLEPMFAKILPTGEEMGIRAGGVGAKPPTNAVGIHAQKRFVQLQMLRDDLDDAIVRDSAEGVINAHKEIVAYLLSLIPKAESRTGAYKPTLKLNRIIRQRIDDIDEIIGGAPTRFDGMGAPITPSSLEDGFDVIEDPQSVADRLVDFYRNGYAGSFQPSNGVDPKIKRLEYTSTSALLDMVMNELEGTYRAFEGGAAIPDAIPRSMTAEGAKYIANRTARGAKRAAERERGAVSSMARGELSRGGKKASARKAQAANTEAVAGIKEMPISDIRKLYMDNAGTARGRQIAAELISREKAQPLPPEPVAVPRELMNMSRADLEKNFLEAVARGDTQKINEFSYHMARLATNRGLKAMGFPPIKVVTKAIRGAIDVEIADYSVPGDISNLGVPPGARASVREMLSSITHREPEIEYVSRTLAYRLMNLVGGERGRTNRGGISVTNADIARIMATEPSEYGDAAAISTKTQEFHNLRNEVRNIAVELSRGEAPAEETMQKIVTLTLRAKDVPQFDEKRIVDFFLASDEGKPFAVARASGDSTFTNEELMKAKDYFAKVATEALAEKTPIDRVLEGKSSFMSIGVRRQYSELQDAMAYMVNGLVGRKDIKKKFRTLDFYGDLFSKSRVKALSDNAVGPRAHDAAAAARARIDSMPETLRAEMDAFTEGTVSRTPDGDTVMWYHASPNKNAMSDPSLVMRPSGPEAAFGPGVYMSDTPSVVDQVFARRPTFEAYRSMIEASDLADDLKADLLMDAEMLVSTRLRLSKYRRQYTSAMVESAWGASGDELQDSIESEIAFLVEKIEDLLVVEDALTKSLASNGIVEDPVVLPLVAAVKNPANFTREATYTSIHDPLIGAIISSDAIAGSVSGKMLNELATLIEMEGGLDGLQMYQALGNLLMRGGKRSASQAKTDIRNALETLGYDGMVTTARNTVGGEDLGDSLLAFTETHNALVVFDERKIKSVFSDSFSEDGGRVYGNGTAVPRGLTGGAAIEMMNDISSLDASVIGDVVEEAGGDKTVSSALMSMVKRRPLSQAEEKAINTHGAAGILMSQSQRMKHMGLNWIGDWYKDHFPDMHQKFASLYYPVHHLLKALPDADGTFRSWLRKSTAGVGQKQPQSYDNIVRAMRHGMGSRQERALTDAERNAFLKIRSQFRTVRDKLTELGVFMGNKGDNYFPQVWDKEVINANRDEFMAEMAAYYKTEKSSFGIEASDEDAMAFALDIYDTLAGEEADGVHIPMFGGSRNPLGDHIDFTRKITLEKYPQHLQALEKFLESDLDSILVKYFEGAARRISHVEKMGINSHGLYDYLLVADRGVEGVARLLSANKEFKHSIRGMTSDGVMKEGVILETSKMPFEGDRAAATEFARELVDVHHEKGAPAAMQMLMDQAPVDHTGKPHRSYLVRAEAIINGISDYKGGVEALSNSDFTFVEESMRVAMKKPQMRSGGKLVSNFSKAVRSFNNVTLLGFTTLSSLGDLALPLIRSGSFKSYVGALTEFAKDPEYRKLINDVGVAMENIVHERMMHLYGAPNSKFSNAFFNATMLTPWTDMNRKIAGAVGFETFGTMQRKALAEFDASKPISEQNKQYRTAHRFLRRYGLEAHLPGGEKEGVSLADKELMGSDQTLRKAIIKFADESIFQPNPNDIPLWAQTPLGAIFFQLKSFPLMMARLGKEVLREADRGNLTPLLYFASVGPAMGMAALASKDIIQSRGGEDAKSPELRDRSKAKILESLGYKSDIHGDENDFLGWYIEGMIQMGGLGLLGDVMHNIAVQMDNGSYGIVRIGQTLLGPSFGDLAAATTFAAGVTDMNPDSNSKERLAARELAMRVPVVGGIARLREAAVDALAGEASSGSGGTGSGTGSGSSSGLGR